MLDLYAGAGTVGIEALSRGAGGCVFVERDRRCCAVIRANLEALGPAAGGLRGRVDCAPAERWLRGRTGDQGRYHLVFADPPYGDAGLSRVISMVVEAGLPEAGGWVVVETRRGGAVPAPAELGQGRRVRHGDSELAMWRIDS